MKELIVNLFFLCLAQRTQKGKYTENLNTNTHTWPLQKMESHFKSNNHPNIDFFFSFDLSI